MRSRALVPLSTDSCPSCGAPTASAVIHEPALLRAGGYGATRRTTQILCPDCPWHLESEVTEVTPRTKDWCDCPDPLLNHACRSANCPWPSNREVHPPEGERPVESWSSMKPSRARCDCGCFAPVAERTIHRTPSVMAAPAGASRHGD